MIRRLARWLLRLIQRIVRLGKNRRRKSPHLSDREYQRLFEELIAGVSRGWNQGDVSQHLGNQFNNSFFRDWLRRYGRELRKLADADRRLARGLVKLSQLGCGELGEIAGDIGRDLLLKPMREEVEEGISLPSDTPPPSDAPPSMDMGDSDEAKVWFGRGYQQAMSGDFIGAIASWDKAIGIKPDYHQAWYNRGVALGNLGRLEEALASYDHAIQIKPDYHDAWSNRGNALFNLGRLEEAIASWDHAIQIKPDFVEAWHNRGSALGNLGRLEESIASYDRAIQIKPDFHDAWHNRGTTLKDLGRLEEAIASYDQAIQIKPDFHEACYNRAFSLSKLGRLEEAIASYDRSIQIKPDYHNAWRNRGIAAGISLNYHPESYILSQLQFPSLPPILPDPNLTQRGYEGELLSYQTGLKHCRQETHPEGWGLLHQYIGQTHYSQGKDKPNYREYWHKALAEYQLSLITLTPEAYPQWHLELLQYLIRVLSGLGQETEAKEWRRKGLDVFGKLLNRPMSRDQEWELRAKFISFSQMRVDILIEEGDFIRAWEAAERDKNFYLSWILDNHKTDIRSPSYQDILPLTNPETVIVYWHLSDFALTTFIIKHGAEEPIVIGLLSNSSVGNPKPHNQILNSEQNADLPTRQGEAFADENPDLPNKLQAQMLHPYQEMSGEGGSDNDEMGAAVGAKHLGDKLSGKPEEINPNASPCFDRVGDKLSGKPEEINPNASPWFDGVGDKLSGKPEEINPNASPCFHEMGYKKLQAWINNWGELYGNYQKKEQNPAWRDNLPGMLAELENILDIPAILEELPEKSIKNLILIPHRDLHRFPLHSLFTDRFVITYLPSMQIGMNLRAENLATDLIKDVTDKLLSIEHPNSAGFLPLPFAEIEAAAITQLFPNHKRITGANATKTAVTTALAENYDILHFTGHGNYNSDRPQNSALFLNNTDTLTLTDICTIPNFSNYKLVTLAACETAITGKEGIDKDYVGLASAFLYQRVASVLSTLWTIPEEASSLFIIYFYWQLRHGKEPAIALKITQKWLRTLTYRKLERYYKVIFAKLPKEERVLRNFLKDEIEVKIPNLTLSQKQAKPFDHPYYWAAFTITGIYKDN